MAQHRNVEHEHARIEVRLMVVAEMLDRAVAEVRRAMAEIQEQGHLPAAETPPPPQPKEGEDGVPR